MISTRTMTEDGAKHKNNANESANLIQWLMIEIPI